MARLVINNTDTNPDTIQAAFEKCNTNYLELYNSMTLVAQIDSTGTGAGVTTVKMEVSETQTLTLVGTARFYTDAGGTLNESTSWNVTSGALRTIYLKAPSGTSTLSILKPLKVIRWGTAAIDGWVGATNCAKITITVGRLALTEMRLSGNSELLGALPSGLTAFVITSAAVKWVYGGPLPTTITNLDIDSINVNWTYTGALPSGLTILNLKVASAWSYSGALPVGLTYLAINNAAINWTGLDISGTGNITTLTLTNYRVAKMSSADMVTLLTSLTNRVGTLPATITINDYADYASPPTNVTDAVAALKAAKSITTVNLGA